jgi:hypothetical protein
MDNDSAFLHNLLGKRVRIVAVDEDDLPPLTLREVSSFGVVAEDSIGAHFYPWTEIVEISAAKNGAVDWAPLVTLKH